MQKILNKRYKLLFIFLFFTISPVYAYAGPGVAIGVVIVFITVVLAFFASFFLNIYKFLKLLITKIFRFISKNDKPKLIKKKSNNKK